MRARAREPGATILVAVVAAGTRRTVVRSLQDAGHRCLPAGDGLEAHALLQREAVDLALLTWTSRA